LHLCRVVLARYVIIIKLSKLGVVWMDNNQLNRLEEMLGTLIKMVGENNGRLKSLEDKTDNAEMNLQGIRDNVKEIIEGQERQDRILEMLSVKSIETDSYIRDFKRKL
jgi:DNA repair ATPase RecN